MGEGGGMPRYSFGGLASRWGTEKCVMRQFLLCV